MKTKKELLAKAIKEIKQLEKIIKKLGGVESCPFCHSDLKAN